MTTNEATNETKRAALPLVKDLAALVRHVKTCIGDDCRASDDPDDNRPAICLTVGWSDETGKWSWQSGDNSFTGGAYGYPHWAVVTVTRRCNSFDLAREIRGELDSLVCY